MACEEKSFIQ